MSNAIFVELVSLISDSFRPVYRRFFSALFQLFVYVMVAFFFFSFVYARSFSWMQCVTFGFACVCVGLSSWFTFRQIQPVLMKGRSQSTIADLANFLFLKGFYLAFLFLSIPIAGLILVFFTYPAIGLVGYSLGLMLSVFLVWLGAGLYKTISDVGSDVIASLEKSVPHFDRRNPLTLLDITGDFLSKLVGFGADLLGSLVLATVACVLFSFSVSTHTYELSVLPIYILVLGLFSSVVGYAWARFRMAYRHFDNVLLESVYVAALSCGLLTWVCMRYVLFLPVGLFFSYVMGLIGAVLFAFGSEFLTSHMYPPAKKMASQAEYGVVIMFLNGVSLGHKSQVLFFLSLLFVILPSYYFGGFYGVSLSGLGLLSVVGMILTVTFFSNFANVLAKLMSLSEATDSDSAAIKFVNRMGRTTVALGNGFAAASSILSTFGLFFVVALLGKPDMLRLYAVDLRLLCGILIGITLPSLFSGYLLSGLTSSLRVMIIEVLRQFREIPFLLEGKANPDMIKSSDVASRLAMDSLVVPAMVMVLIPTLVGYVWGTSMLLGLVMGTLLQGFVSGVSQSITGGILTSAKYVIQKGSFGGATGSSFQTAIVAENLGKSFENVISPSMTIVMRGVLVVVVYLLIMFNL